jgi:hypothetical protein
MHGYEVATVALPPGAAANKGEQLPSPLQGDPLTENVKVMLAGLRVGALASIRVTLELRGVGADLLIENSRAPAAVAFVSMTYWFRFIPNWKMPNKITTSTGATIANSTTAVPLSSATSFERTIGLKRIIRHLQN